MLHLFDNSMSRQPLYCQFIQFIQVIRFIQFKCFKLVQFKCFSRKMMMNKKTIISYVDRTFGLQPVWTVAQVNFFWKFFIFSEKRKLFTITLTNELNSVCSGSTSKCVCNQTNVLVQLGVEIVGDCDVYLLIFRLCPLWWYHSISIENNYFENW